ncbi:MAG: hypothetical protein K8R21_11185 [Leptospira sp.]|nr:hypothetical protein [Leptospira sp.]
MKKFSVTALLFFGSLLSVSVNETMADDARTNGFRYYKGISGSDKIDPASKEPQYGRFLIDEEISRYSGSNDRRIVFNGKLLPFFTREALKTAGKTGQKIPKIIFNEVRENKRVYVLKLPDLADDLEYSELSVTNEGQYETTVNVSFSNNPDYWENSEIKSIYRYAGDVANSSGKIQFFSGKYSYIRLEFDSKEEFFFPHLTYSPVKEQMEYKTEIALSDLKKSSDGDSKATIYYFDNPLSKPFRRIVLQFKEERFKRNIEIAYKDGRKNYVNLVNSVIEKKKSDKTGKSIFLTQTVHSPLKLTIMDGDDSPLTLNSFEAFSPVEEIIFQLPPLDPIPEKTEFRIYYGNKYAYYPEFDFQKTLEENPRLINFSSGEHTTNEKFSYSITEPPLSSWIIRIVFLLGVGAISFPAYRVFRKYSKEATL